MKTLEQILEKEKQHRHEEGDFGIKACKELIKFEVDWRIGHKQASSCVNALFTLLNEYFLRAQDDIFFNKTMVLACWELLNDVEYIKTIDKGVN